jgi:hypothetical protein
VHSAWCTGKRVPGNQPMHAGCFNHINRPPPTLHLHTTRASAEDCNPTYVERLVSHPSEIRVFFQRSENRVVVTRGSQLTARSRRGYEDVFTHRRGKVRRLVRATANVGIGYLDFVGEKKQDVTGQSNSRGMVLVSMIFLVV